MIVDLGEMYYRDAIDLIHWCVANEIDKPRTSALLYALSAQPGDDKRNVVWEIDIPEDKLTWFLLEHGREVLEQE